MKSILFINGCVRGAQSRTLGLAQKFLGALQKKYPACTLETVDLNALRLQPLLKDTLAERDGAAGHWESPHFALARQFKEAGLVVFAAPFWEGTFPAALHTYIEHICVTGLTFGYTPEGAPEGYCRAQCAVFFSTRGGIYSQGPAKEDDHAEAFLGSVLRMLGVPRLDTVTAEGLDIVGMDAEAILSEAEKKTEELMRTF